MRTPREDTNFRILSLLARDPEISQRQMASELGISLGGVNYCVRALLEKGQIKVRNFRASENKLRYAYVLTPKGLDTKTRLAAGFLKRKMAEYERLRREIEVLQEEVDCGDLSAARDV